MRKPLVVDGVVIDKQFAENLKQTVADIRNSVLREGQMSLALSLSYNVALISDYISQIDDGRTLDDDLRKFAGLAPWNTPSNIVYGDAYFLQSLASKYGTTRSEILTRLQELKQKES